MISEIMMNGKFTKNVTETFYATRSSAKGIGNMGLHKEGDATKDSCAKDNCNRLKAGNQRSEIFYDCEEAEEDEIFQQQLQVFEVINEINNPKEFKGLLKQIAYTSNILYQSFRKANSKTNKRKLKMMQNYCDKCEKRCAKVTGQLHANDGTKKLSGSRYRYLKQQACSCYMCSRGKEKICTKCYGLLESEQFSQKYSATERPKPKANENVKAESSNICQQYEEELKHLNFCERCAVLRGETHWPSKAKEVSQDPNTKAISSIAHTQAPNCLNLKPVQITVPLRLQIDGENCQPHFMETEIIMDTFGDYQSNTMTPTYAPAHVYKWQRDQGKSDSATFYSCISNSGIIQPDKIQNISDDNAIREILEMIKQYILSSQDMPKLKPVVETKPPESKDIRISLPTSSTATASTVTKRTPSSTAFAQTTEMLPPPTSLQLLDPKLKATRLRGELLKEIRTALGKTTTVEALKTLREGKRFSLPTNLRPKETVPATRVRQSAPSAYQGLPTGASALRSFAAPSSKTLGSIKPELPPKPTIPPKPTKLSTETVRKDASTSESSGHFKRTDMRNKIQEDLTELLDEKPSKSRQSKYKPEERDEILLDLHRLFHPQRTGSLPERASLENALEDIRYILEPEEYRSATVTAAAPTTSDSQDSILKSIRHILNPKTEQKSTKKTRYSKNAKEKILEDLHILLTPRNQRAASAANREVRDSVLQDLQFMLDSGHENTTDRKSSKLPESQKSTAAMVDTNAAAAARAEQMRQDREHKSPNEIRDSVMADLRYLLDTTRQPTENEVRDSVLQDLRFMLDSGHENTTDRKSSKLPESQKSTAAVVDTSAAAAARAEQVRQDREHKSPNEIRNSVMADLRYLLDTTHQPTENADDIEVITASDIPEQPATITSEDSSNDSFKSL